VIFSYFFGDTMGYIANHFVQCVGLKMGYVGLYRYIDCIPAFHGCFNTENGDSAVDFCVFPIIKVPKPYNGFVTNNFRGMCLLFQWNLVNAMTAIRKEDQFASHLVDRYRPFQAPSLVKHGCL